MNRPEALALLEVLQAAYPRQEVTPTLANLYCSMLADIDAEAAVKAVLVHIATNPYLPAISEIRSLVAESAAGVPDADQAWAEVLSEVRRVGSYGVPKFSHPAIAACVEGVGWRCICLSENIATERAHFLRMYGDVKKRVVREAKTEERLANRLRREGDR